MVYVAVALWTYLLFYNKNNKKFKDYKDFQVTINRKESIQKISISAVILLILFAGLRTQNVGFDTPVYFENIKNIVDNGNINVFNYEFLFQLINLISALILKNYYAFNVMLIISFTIILCCVCYASKNLSTDISLTMFLYVCVDVYLRSFGQLRQGIAIAILIVSVIFIKNKKPIQFFACVFLAMCFHKTAILFSPVYFLDKFKSKYLHYVVIFVLAIVFCIFNNQIIKIICDIFNLKYYDYYIASDYGRQSFTLIGIIEIISITLIFIFFFAYRLLYEKKYREKINREYIIFLNILFLCFIMYYVSFFLQKPELFGRLVYYFFWVIIFIVPNFLSTLKNEKLKIYCKYGMMLVGMLYLIFAIFLNDAYGISNYQSILISF